MNWLLIQYSLMRLVAGDVQCMFGRHDWRTSFPKAMGIEECRRGGCTAARNAATGQKLR